MRPRRLRDHVRRHRARHVEHAGHVGVEHVLHVGIGKSGQRIVADRAGVVDQHVDAPGALDHALDRRGAGRGIAHVDLLRGHRAPAAAAAATTACAASALLAIEERDVGAFRAPAARRSRGRCRGCRRSRWRSCPRGPKQGHAPCSSRDREPAVDDERVAVDHRGFRQAQEVHRAGDVVGRQHRSGRRALREIRRAAPRDWESTRARRCRPRRRSPR